MLPKSNSSIAVMAKSYMLAYESCVRYQCTSVYFDICIFILCSQHKLLADFCPRILIWHDFIQLLEQANNPFANVQASVLQSVRLWSNSGRTTDCYTLADSGQILDSEVWPKHKVLSQQVKGCISY